MSEETTKEQPDARSFEERVSARFDALDARFDSLEERVNQLDGRMDSFDARLASLDEKVDRRLQETRPIWEAVLAQLEQLNSKFKIVADDLLDLRAKVDVLDRRVTTIESERA
jgi:chromosome segregation ATPase